MIIYRLTSPSGKSYVGKTKATLPLRFKQHVTHWKSLKGDKSKYNKGPKLLYHAFDKYGPPSFIQEIITTCDSIHALNEQEIHFITLYGDYNISIGGDGRITETLEDTHKDAIAEARRKWFQTPEGQEWKRKLSKRLVGNTLQKGKVAWNNGMKGVFKHSDSTKLKISERTKGRAKTAEHKAKISASKRGKPLNEAQEAALLLARQSRYGKRQTDHQKDVARQTHANLWLVTYPDGHVEEVFSLRKFAIENGLDQGNLSRGKHKGYRATKLNL